jgi:hypothetical protein
MNTNKLNTMTTKRTKREPKTAADRIKHIELDVNRHGVAIAMAIDRIVQRLTAIESSVAVIRSGATFMQQMEQDVAAMEAAKTPKFGDRVEYQDDMGWKIAMDVATPDGIWTIVKSGHARMAWAKRHEFRIIS